MKTKQFLLVLVCLMTSVATWAYDFEVDGIYYKITSDEELTVSVTYEGEYGWNGHKSYTGDIVIPSQVNYNDKLFIVKSIDYYAFYCNEITSIEIPISVETIRDRAFEYCRNLKTISLPNSVKLIGNWAFHYCSGLNSISIPSSVISIGEEAFGGCSNVESITVDSNNSCYDSRENSNCLIETSSNELILGCKNSIIPSSVTKIAGMSFYQCSDLLSIDLPNSIVSIGEYAFRECNGLTFINFPNSLKFIGEGSFMMCEGITSLVLPNSLESIGNSAFSNCKGIQNVEIPSSVTKIGNNPFEGCYNLEQISVSPNNIYYDSRDNCNAIIQTATNTLVTGCKNSTIPYEITNIGYGAFSGCRYLESIILPKSIKSVGDWAFSNTENLREIKISNTIPPTLQTYTFANMSISRISLFVPESAIEAYKTAEIWKECVVEGYTCLSTSISLNKENSTLRPGFSDNLVAIDLPIENTNNGFTWKSDNEAVAIVDNNGKVSAISTGNANISATALDNSNNYATCNVNVVESGSNAVYTNDFEYHRNKNSSLPIYMDNAEKIGNVQFDIQLPSGVGLRQVTRGADRFDEDLDHTVSYCLISGTNPYWASYPYCAVYRVTIISNTNSTIYDTDIEGNDCRNTSPLVNLGVTVYDWALPEVGDVIIQNVIMSNVIDGITTKYTCDSRCSSFTIPQLFTVNANALNGGEVSIDGEEYNSYKNNSEENTQVTFTATPNTGYSFKRWFKGEEEFSSENPLTLTVTEDINLTAEFSINQYNVKFIADGNIISEQNLDYGSVINIPDAPEKSGYKFYSWGNVPKTVPDCDLEFIADYFILGDIYDDSTIDVADVTKLAGIVCNNTWLSDREKKQADVFKDNSIDVADVSALVNLALSYVPVNDNSSAGAKAIVESSTAQLYGEISYSMIGNCILGIGLHGSVEGTKSLQFDMQLPEGVLIESISLSNEVRLSHSVVTRILPDGSTRFIVYSLSNKTMYVENGNILNVVLSYSDNANDICLTNGIFVDSENKKNCLGYSVIDMATGIFEVSSIASDINIKTSKGMITITSKDDSNVSVCSMSGAIIFLGMVSSSQTVQIPVSKGVYIVNNSKVVVK